MFAEQISEKSPVVRPLSSARRIHVLVLIPTLTWGERRWT